LTRSQKRKL
jgi:hypothetical protein